ncbi:MAG TPA: phospho-N-acetylmuramoyl-pentapeptide-transferase [Armatimonadota bacterium]|nr:phospho-N-acetylmuramoyl-pentapeptide-transferase [Armatimonadota bacterium]
MLVSYHIYILITAMLLAFLVTFLTAIPVIAFLRAKKLGQTIREDGPQTHEKKAGTPTMGGVVILLGAAAGTIASWYFFPRQFWFSVLVLALMTAVAGIGAIDDWGKITRGRGDGLKARQKLALQFLAAGLFLFGLWWLDVPPTLHIPFTDISLNLGWWFWPLAALFIAFMSNAVNLTDGLDGLAAGSTTAAAFAMAGLAWLVHENEIMPMGHAMATFLACLGAACLAFLWYNQHPAKVFMGDTGSLAIGAALAGAALIIKQEVLFLSIGLIFLIETVSVMLQVVYFQLTKRLTGEGKRIFRMTPFHHHLELGGWKETQIVTRAWLLAVILAAAAFWLYRRYGG